MRELVLAVPARNPARVGGAGLETPALSPALARRTPGDAWLDPGRSADCRRVTRGMLDVGVVAGLVGIELWDELIEVRGLALVEAESADVLNSSATPLEGNSRN